MSTIKNHINTYATTTAYDADMEKDYPNVSYIEEDDIVLFESEPKYEEQYFTIKSLANNNAISFKASSASLKKTISVSTDDGTTWTNYTSTTRGTTIATLNMGQKVLIKGNNYVYANTSGYNYFSSTQQFDVNGNIMSLIYGDNFKEKYSFPSGTQFNFYNLFSSAPVVSAEKLILPATTLTSNCYSSMFQGCTSLTAAPELPATTLTNHCYGGMFQGCTSLTAAPELPATTLASWCYRSMFEGCTSLTAAPELPATTLAQECYPSMFSGCTSLTTAPVLPATTLVAHCYHFMFQNCTSLTTAPELPATTLAEECYNQMFRGCTSLTTAPELPATTLTSYCYSYMFNGCSSLNYIKAMFTTTPSGSYTYNWVGGVAATGTFVKNMSATWDVSGDSGIPTGWTVRTANS